MGLHLRSVLNLIIIWLCLYGNPLNGFEYKQICGQLSDSQIKTTPGLLLSGGADSKSPDEVIATQWLINHAHKGDYLVLRSNGLGKQAAWVCQHFADHITSAAEISIDSIEDASNPAVIQLIESVEILWIAGGDQTRYHRYWTNTPLAHALNQHLKSKPIGGTSAGMAILGGAYYAPKAKAVSGSDLLDNPFHVNSQDIFFDGLLQHPYLHNALNETHLDRILQGENRTKRALGLLARLSEKTSKPIVIALNEGSFLGIDDQGIGTVWGNGGYLLMTSQHPEQMTAGRPLIWHRNGGAVTALKLQPADQPHLSLDFKNRVFSGLLAEHWYTTAGSAGFTRH